MSEIEDDVDSSLKELGILDSCKLPIKQAQGIVAKAMQLFVKGNPRVWWLSLKNPHRNYVCKRDCSTCLPERLAGYTETVYFIPETESLEPMPVYQLSPNQLCELIGGSGYFEYYIVTSDFKTLLIETEHGQFIETHAPDAEAVA
ncbi:MAG: hypothetical protein P1V97_23405 [Planctomycetota bacterium]|nr:hypothetical protein [Planctomycetota bacterium]